MRRALAAFTAATLVGGAAATLALAPQSAARAQYVPAEEADTQTKRRAAFDRSDGPTLALQLDPAFDGLGVSRRTCPLVVRVKNRGAATSAEITFDAAGDAGAGRRTYVRRVDLPGGGAVSRFFLYPSADSGAYYYNGYGDTFHVRVRTPSRSAWETISFPYFGDRQQVGYIGDRPGALNLHAAERAWRELREQQGRHPANETYSTLTPCHADPEDAPDRAVGYSSLNHLVLGEGAERLTEAQWRAIRGWVQTGGSLILTEGCRPGAAAEAAGLSPVTGEASGFFHVDPATEPTDIGGLKLPTGPFTVTSRDLAPGTRNLGPWAGEGGAKQTALARRDVGMGTVLYVGFDPTHSTFRSWADLNQLWAGLLKRAAPPVPAVGIAQLAADRSDTLTAGFSTPGAQGRQQADPFSVRMPHLRTVVYLFLGYFVLVVPVTFVVLKRTRRMNLAWLTGPTLAVGVAGALYLFATDLYRAPSSRRTAGVLVATNGEPDARFTGYTELFFSRAGRYDVSVPGAESIELSPNLSRFSEYSDHHGGAASGALRTLETRDDGAAVTEARLPVSNLSFRRVYHEQPVALGGAIEVKAEWDEDGTVSYTLRNGSRRALQDIYLLVADPRPAGKEGPAMRRIAVDGGLAPGMAVSGKAAGTLHLQQLAGIQYRDGNSDLYRRVCSGRTALLMARTDGSDLGPSAGRYAGGDRSVLVAVAVPNPTMKGGR